MKKYIFACVHNAGRSQMAAAWFNQLADGSKAQALSAGTQPGTRVHPEVLEAMREQGIDLSQAKPQLLTDDLARESGKKVELQLRVQIADEAVPPCQLLPNRRRVPRVRMRAHLAFAGGLPPDPSRPGGGVACPAGSSRECGSSRGRPARRGPPPDRRAGDRIRGNS